jgi:hypothetical protein
MMVAAALLGSAACGMIHVDPAPSPAASAAPPDSAPRAAPPRGSRFYTGKTFGSEAQFNPFSLIVNGGFDQLRTTGANRQVFRLPYDAAARGQIRSISRPDLTIKEYGFENWLRKQILPLSSKGSGGGQWVPNYQLHLLGGGMTGVRITEWYQQHGAAHPELAAAATVATWHFLTEMIEHPGDHPRSADALSDLLIFDPAAFLLWRNDRVQRLFSTRVQMTTWSGQPALTTPRTTLQNMHQTQMLRSEVPWTDDFRPMTTFGGSFLLGISARRGVADWITLAGGWDPADNPVIDPATGEKTVTLLPNAGLFYDRDGSLLASLLVRARRTERVTINVYPGVVHFFGWSPGLWAHILDNGRFRFGVVPKFGLGIGVE